MTTTQTLLADRCDEVAALSRRAIEWIGDPENAETVGFDTKSLTRLLRRSARRADKLGRSARTKMSVSVFGPSQAGKSFLVSVLARPPGGRLVADYPGPGGKLDYIREINPEGEGESTGLVTRFTMSRDPAPDGFPVRLSLLTEADIARTIINSFFMDGDQSEPPAEPADLQAHLDAHRGRMAATEHPGLAFEDVIEIGEYLEGNFGRTAFAAALKGFWDEAATIAPRLALSDRAAFLSLLWGGHAALTDLYVTLARPLAEIGHAEEVHVGLDALTPRETSIIDVKTLHGLGADDGGNLDVRTPDGRTVALPRAIVCALAAELVLPMETQPSEIFGETDLLDFPGARNRFEQPLSKTLADASSVTQLLLRGKVAFLFDRYVENQEITSMLLCVPDSNMETLDLPGLVENWIGMTHGNRPAERRATDCILFFVLTKFDKHLGDSAAGGGAETRFERRMHASLLEKFGKSKDPWVDEWTPGVPFQNCYWLRNPNFFVEGLLEYDDNQREVRIRPEKEERVAELKAGCLSAPSVVRHFSDPEAAWDAAMRLNDGGVGYLTADLAAVCTPDSKVRQIGAQIDRVASDIRLALAGYHVSDDAEQRAEERRAAAHAVIDALETALRAHRFGAVLHALMVGQDAIQDRISRVPSDVRINSAVSAAQTQAAAPAATQAVRPGGGAVRPVRPGRPAAVPVAAETQAPAPRGPGIRTMTPEAFQAETAVEVWIERLTEFREDADRIADLGFTADTAADLVNELVQALRRVRLVDDIVAELRTVSFGHTVDRQALPAAIVCSERINGFVATLGADRLPMAARPVVQFADGATRPVFPQRAGADGVADLPALPRATSEDTWTDWVHALEAMFVANARDEEGGETNVEQNLRLRGILTGLAGEDRAA